MADESHSNRDDVDRHIQEEFARIDTLSENAFDTVVLQKRLDDAEARAKLIAAKSDALQFVIDLVRTQLSESLELLGESRNRLGSVAQASDAESRFASLCAQIRSGPAGEETLRLTAELMSLANISVQLGAITASQARLTNLRALGVALGARSFAAFAAQCMLISATRASLPQPPRERLLKVHDALELALKIVGPIVNPIGAAVASGVVETCKWLRNVLLESGPKRKDVAKTLVVLEQLLTQWEKFAFPPVVEAVTLWSRESFEAMEEAREVARTTCGAAGAEQGGQPERE